MNMMFGLDLLPNKIIFKHAPETSAYFVIGQ